MPRLTPFPDRFIVCVPTSSVMFMMAVRLPVAVGVKVTGIVQM